VLRMISALIAVTWLSGSQPPQPAPTPAQPTEQQTVTPQQPAAVPTPSLDPDRKTALVLLDRIETLVENALEDKSDKDKSDKDKAVATSGNAEIKTGSLEGKSGRVTVDRATLDEILSEVAQVKMMLQR
jgi:hypothetical protein